MQPISFQHYLTHPTERDMYVILGPDDYKLGATIGNLTQVIVPTFNYFYVKHADNETVYTPDKYGNLDKETIFKIPKYYNRLAFAPADFLPTFYGFETYHASNPEVLNFENLPDDPKNFKEPGVKFVLLAKSNLFVIFLMEDETFYTWGCLGDFKADNLQECISWLEKDSGTILVD